MATFSEARFYEKFDLASLDQTVASTIRLATQNPNSLYLFFQRYTHFNGYASAVISRLASSIGISRYLFANSEELVTEEADRGMDIAAKVMFAAADEGAYGVSHRSLAQATLKTVGDYAQLATKQRNQFAQIPAWLDVITKEVVSGYQGTPGDIASLVQAMGFHAASEIMGDREYTLLDTIIRHENQGVGFDSYLRQNASSVEIQGHRYNPWCWVLIHSRYEDSGVEVEHFEQALEALNLCVLYRSEPEQQILEWGLQGFEAFVKLQQRLFREVYRECLELQQACEAKYAQVA